MVHVYVLEYHWYHWYTVRIPVPWYLVRMSIPRHVHLNVRTYMCTIWYVLPRTDGRTYVHTCTMYPYCNRPELVWRVSQSRRCGSFHVSPFAFPTSPSTTTQPCIRLVRSASPRRRGRCWRPKRMLMGHSWCLLLATRSRRTSHRGTAQPPPPAPGATMWTRPSAQCRLTCTRCLSATASRASGCTCRTRGLVSGM